MNEPAKSVRHVFTDHLAFIGLGVFTSIAVFACGSSTPTSMPAPQASIASAKATASAAPTISAAMPKVVEPPPPPPPDPVPSQAVIDAANQAKNEITNLPSELQGEPKRECLGDSCHWNYGFAAPSKNGQMGVYGIIGIDEKSLAVTFQTGNGDPVPLSVYVVLSKREAAVVKAAAMHAEVKRMCANSSRQGAPCAIYSDQMPTAMPCPANPAPTDACLWGVYVGSNMGSHVSRLATIYVEPSSAKVVGISDLVCPPISPAEFHAREVRRAAKPPDDDHYCD